MPGKLVSRALPAARTPIVPPQEPPRPLEETDWSNKQSGVLLMAK